VAALERLPPEPAPPPVAADAIPIGARRRAATSGQAFAAILTGAVALAFLAGGDLPSWAERLPDGGLAPLLREATATWSRTVDRLGVSAPHEAVRHAVQRLMELGW
jgi:hypothetical protein